MEKTRIVIIEKLSLKLKFDLLIISWLMFKNRPKPALFQNVEEYVFLSTRCKCNYIFMLLLHFIVDKYYFNLQQLVQ